MISTDASGGHLFRQGLDLVLDWPDFASARLHNWKDHRDGGIKGELTITQNGAKYSWGTLSLASTTARGTLVKQLAQLNPEIPWRAHLEELAWRFTQEARIAEPLVTLTGDSETDAQPLLPGWLYEGEPTLLYADGDTGKSMTALALAIAMQTGVALPCGLLPTRAVQTAYLDWETSQATTNRRLRLLSSGLGIPPPPILYKRMTRPLIEEIGTLAVELARRKVGFVVIDSKMFAVAGGEGAAFHEPITAFYTALRLFAPAAVLVLNHITNADAKTGTPARPFGGAFAFNGPRVMWEAKRDPEVDDATVIVFTSKKTNNLARKPDAFGLIFRGADNVRITIDPLDLATVAPQTFAGANITQRIKLLLSAPMSVDDLVKALPHAKPDSVSRILRRLKREFAVTQLKDARYVMTAPLERGQRGQHAADTVRSPRLAPPENPHSKDSPGADGQFLYKGLSVCPPEGEIPTDREPGDAHDVPF